MSPDKPLYPQVVDHVADMTKRVIDEVAKQLGPVGEPVSKERQMEAYQELTNEDWVALTAKHGEDKVRRYIRVMESRKARSNNG